MAVSDVYSTSMCIPAKKNEGMRDWSELQQDLLGLIAQRLPLFEDSVAFSGVCKSWRSVALNLKKNFSTSLSLPWLMLPERYDSDTRGFFSLSKGSVHHRKLPEAAGKTRCWGSQGWLITVGEDHNVNLLNPLTRLQIQLPHKRTIKKLKDYYIPPKEVHKYYFLKAILSSNPSYNSDYVVMVIHGSLSQLAFARPGDEAWTSIITWPYFFFDIAYCKGKFYAINVKGEILVCDINGPNPTRAACVATVPTKLLAPYTKLYIVESSGELLVVSRVSRKPGDIFGFSYKTIGFQVFRLDLKNSTCTEVENLGEWALFLGYSSSMSIKASDFPGCQTNCIYFTDDYWCNARTRGKLGSGIDMGIFNLEDRSIKPHFRAGSSSIHQVSPPMWVVPSL